MDHMIINIYINISSLSELLANQNELLDTTTIFSN